MRLIQLSDWVHSALVDEEDWDRVVKHRWCLQRSGGYRNRLYAQANIKVDGQWKRVLMHRFILVVAADQRCDHIDGNGLNNQRSNLRIATACQNQHNSGRRIYKGKRSSRFKGVHWSKKAKKWLAQICVGGKRHYLGVYEKEEDAALAYQLKAREFHGEFARFD